MTFSFHAERSGGKKVAITAAVVGCIASAIDVHRQRTWLTSALTRVACDFMLRADEADRLLLAEAGLWWCRRAADVASANLNVEEPAWSRTAAAEDIFDEVGTKASACGQQPPPTTAAAAMSGIFMSLRLSFGSYV